VTTPTARLPNRELASAASTSAPDMPAHSDRSGPGSARGVAVTCSSSSPEPVAISAVHVRAVAQRVGRQEKPRAAP
jgi:hypothetical protein